MPTADRRRDRAASAPRRTVRILQPTGARRAAIVSLLIVGAAALALFLVWRAWRTDVPLEPRQRSLSDVELTWRCTGGHTFPAAGQTGSRTCIYCGQEAFNITNYVCPSHGSFEVAVRFVQEGTVFKPGFVRLAGRDWLPAAEELRCPRCGVALEHRREDPLAAGRKKSGG